MVFIQGGRQTFWFHAASITRRMVTAIPGLIDGHVGEISPAVIALTLGDRPRLQNDALAKIIQNVDHHLSCFIRGSRVVPRVLLFVQCKVATQGSWLPPSLPPLPSLITSEGSDVKLAKQT